MTIKNVAVIGLGYVGLPLAIHLARAKYKVVGVDINRDLINTLQEGRSPTPDLPHELFPIAGDFTATTEVPPNFDAYIICVPTPHIKGENKLDATFVLSACNSVGHVIGDGGIVVVESTVTPGSTYGMLRGSISLRKGDHNFRIAFSPERVNPGPTYFYEMDSMGKLIGAGEDCAEELRHMYARIFGSVELIGVEEAELVKTFENAQRDINIAMMNEMALQCYRKGLDYPAVIRGLRTKKSSPVFNSGMVGGHCIPVDPYFLGEYYDDPACLSFHGRDVNEEYIQHVATIAIDCNSDDGPILIVGRSYKAGVADERNSGSLKLQDYLSNVGVHSVVHDPIYDAPYEGPPPSVVIGAINHSASFHPFEEYECRFDAVFINIGGAFTDAQCEPFINTIQL